MSAHLNHNYNPRPTQWAYTSLRPRRRSAAAPGAGRRWWPPPPPDRLYTSALAAGLAPSEEDRNGYATALPLEPLKGAAFYCVIGWN